MAKASWELICQNVILDGELQIPRLGLERSSHLVRQSKMYPRRQSEGVKFCSTGSQGEVGVAVASGVLLPVGLIFPRL